MGRLKLGDSKGKRSFKKIVFTVVIAFAVVAFWRGVWGLMDLYFFPSNLVTSLWLSVLIGVAILYFTKHLIADLI